MCLLLLDPSLRIRAHNFRYLKEGLGGSLSQLTILRLTRIYYQAIRILAYSLLLFYAYVKGPKLFAMPLLYSPVNLPMKTLKIMARL